MAAQLLMAASVVGAIVIAAFLTNGEGLPNHLRWNPGFAAPDGFLSWLLMWWQLWGMAIPMLAVGLWSLRREDALPWVLFGGGLLCLFDGLARLAFAVLGSEVPVGAACALVGAPLFAVLLWRTR